MSERVFIDTNVLFYARDDRFPDKQLAAAAWLEEVFGRGLAVVSPQVIGEFYNAALKRRIMAEAELRHAMTLLEPWSRGQIDLELVEAAWGVRQHTGFQWWDCMVVAAAIAADCRILLSEDMSHQRTIEGVTIVNPFRAEPAEMLGAH